MVTNEKRKVFDVEVSNLRARGDDSSKIIKKTGKNAYKLESFDDNNILPTFNVKDLRSYHGEDLRTNLFPNMGIDAGASTTNIRNSISIMENSDLRGCETLETQNIFLFPRILSLVTILIWSCIIIVVFDNQFKFNNIFRFLF